MELPFSISDNALNQLSKIIESNEKASIIRVGVEGTACAGLTHKIEPIPESKNDFLYIYKKIKIAIRKDQLIYLVNLYIDFNNNEFVYDNPNLPKEVDVCEL